MADDIAAAASEPRILPLAPEELSEEGRALAAKLRANFGLGEAMPDAIATMLRHPDLYRAQVEYVVARTKALVLAPRDLEIVILRTAWLCKSGYSWGEHVKFGKKAGLTAQEIEWIVQGSSAPGWNARDRALNRICEELHDTSFVGDDTWAAIAANFTDKQIIEILTIIGAYHEVAYLYNAMRIRPIPGNPGLAAR